MIQDKAQNYPIVSSWGSGGVARVNCNRTSTARQDRLVGTLICIGNLTQGGQVRPPSLTTARSLRATCAATDDFTDEHAAVYLPGVHALGVGAVGQIAAPLARYFTTTPANRTLRPPFSDPPHSSQWRQCLAPLDHAYEVPVDHQSEPCQTQHHPVSSRSADISPAGQVAEEDTSMRTA